MLLSNRARSSSPDFQLTPGHSRRASVARRAALAVGVLAYALINDVLAAPDYHPVLATRLDALHRQVMRYAESVTRGDATSATATD